MNENKSLILMVEDEEQVLNTNCRMLRRRGYDVRTAQTVSEVYHQLEEQLPDRSGTAGFLCRLYGKRSRKTLRRIPDGYRRDKKLV